MLTLGSSDNLHVLRILSEKIKLLDYKSHHGDTVFVLQHPRFDEILDMLRLQKRGTGKFFSVFIIIICSRIKNPQF